MLKKRYSTAEPKFGLQFGSDLPGQILSYTGKSVLLVCCYMTFYVQNDITQGIHSSVS